MKKIVLLVTTLLLLTSCVGDQQMQNFLKTGFTPTFSETKVQSSQPVLFNTDSVLNVNSFIEYDPYLIAVHIPQTTSVEVNKALEQWATEKISDFKSIACKDSQKVIKELNINYDQFQLTDEIVSYKFNILSSFDGLNTTKQIETKTFDLNEGKVFYINKIVKDQDAYIDHLATLVQAQLHENGQVEEVLNLTKFEEGTKPSLRNYSNFVLSQGNVTFFFDEQQIGETRSDEALEASIAIEDLMNLYETTYPEAEFFNSILEKKKQEENKGKKFVALTFDDGPHAVNTAYLLQQLDKYNAKATFFLLGNRVGLNQEILKDMQAAGHEIGNHTYAHKAFNAISSNEIRQQVLSTDKAIEEITGKKTSVLRPPYGIVNDTVLRISTEEELPLILWNIDPEDWRIHDANTVSQHILNKVTNGDIILLHDIFKTSVDAAVIVLDELTKQGYQFVTVSELLSMKDQEIHMATPYRHALIN